MKKIPLGPELSRAVQMLHKGQLAEAERICRLVRRTNPKDIDAHQLLGMIASQRGRLEDAASHFQEGLRIAPGTVKLLCGLGQARIVQGRYDDAVARFEEALKTEPGHPVALAGMADALERKGDLDRAREVLEPLIATGTETTEAALSYARLLQREIRHEEAVDLLKKHLESRSPTEISRRRLLFALGASLEKLEDYDGSFDAYRRANELLRQPFDINRFRREIDAIIEVFSQERLASAPRATNTSELPVFVVSMPRSGSTLIEQILAAHPLVYGAGEIDEMLARLRELEQQFGRTRFPQVVTKMNQGSAETISERHLAKLQHFDRHAERITDKHLKNFLLLGLAWLLFPGRAIYCRRDPVDTCFSCYMHPLSPAALPHTTDLRNLGLYYREFERLMQHWMDVLDLPILTVQYEELVADQERISRELISFCGLEWDDACLEFYASKRSVSTMSYDQVRRPIYTSAVKRYEKYAHHLGPLFEALGQA